MTPRFCIFSKYLAVSAAGCFTKISFKVIFTDSVKFAPLPILPFASAVKEADVTFLIWVIGLKIVFAYSVIACPLKIFDQTLLSTAPTPWSARIVLDKLFNISGWTE